MDLKQKNIIYMKVIKAKKLKWLLNKYAQDKELNEKNKFNYIWFRGIYDSRFLGLCIYRHTKAFENIFSKYNS